MKQKLILAALLSVMAVDVIAQGSFINVVRLPTRVGSIDGPLAGPEILGQLFVGLDPDNLFPLEPPRHFDRGIYRGLVNTVDQFPCGPDYDVFFIDGYVQLMAWNGDLWGNSLDQVPPDQVGRTDIAHQAFTCPPYPIVGVTGFTVPAIVPVPEPALGLLTLAITSFWLWRRRRRRSVSLSTSAPLHSLLLSDRGPVSSLCYGCVPLWSNASPSPEATGAKLRSLLISGLVEDNWFEK